MYKNQSGFSMLEAIISLSLIVIIVAVSFSFTYRTYDTYQYKQFIEQFELDLFYLQQLAITKKETYYLNFERDQNRYHIRKTGIGKKMTERIYPADWVIEPNSMDLPIEFSNKGNFKKPGKMKVTTKFQQYMITCPFGKGRCYDEKL